MDRIFLDYLDYNTFDTRSSKERFYYNYENLAGDILCFPEATLFVAAPAIAKCRDTAMLLTLTNRLWNRSRIKYVLSPNYKGDFGKYVEQRKEKLAKSFAAKDLNKHFEYTGYISDYWPAFFNDYLVEYSGINPHESRQSDCDYEFREIVKSRMANDDFADTLNRNGFYHPEGLIQALENIANDKQSLFQREAIVDSLMINGTSHIIGDILHNSMDDAFSYANAAAAGALTPNESNGLNNSRLRYIASSISINGKRTLWDVIRNISLDDAVILSEQIEWKGFLKAINTKISQLSTVTQNDKEMLKLVCNQLPHARKSFLINIGTVLIAYSLAGVYSIFGVMERIISSIFTNLPSGFMSFSQSMMGNDIVDATEHMAHMVKRNFSQRHSSGYHFNKASQFYSARGIT